MPYLDGRFSLVTCIETITRLGQTRPILREIFRVLEPGGLAVTSIPNTLNLPSRLRYLTSGFFENRGLVATVNSRDLLVGRTLIVCARKPM